LTSQEDFFNDLEKEVNAWSEKRGKSGQPASLWEELSAIGEELVDFLEQGLSDEYKSSSTERGKDGSSSGGSAEFNHSGKARTPVDKYEELKRRYDMYDESFKKGAAGGSSSSRSSSSSNNGTSRWDWRTVCCLLDAASGPAQQVVHTLFAEQLGWTDALQPGVSMRTIS
jgi:hypothetical protein